MGSKIKSLLENNTVFFLVELTSIIVVIATGIIYGFTEGEINWIFITSLLFLVEIIFETLRKNSKKQSKDTSDYKIQPTKPGKILLKTLGIICISIISLALFIIVFL